MPIIRVRVCFLCYQKGELKEAVGYYSPKGENDYDVCEDCKMLVETEEHIVLPIEIEDVVDEL